MKKTSEAFLGTLSRSAFIQTKKCAPISHWTVLPLLFFASVLFASISAATFGDYTYTTNAVYAIITKYNGPGGEVTIPATIEGKPVINISPGAFASKPYLTSVTIPFGVMAIMPSTFSDCGGLTNVLMPDSITNINTKAFFNCSKLTSVRIPNGVTSIGTEVFSGCSSLTNITIPASLGSLSDKAFYGCRSLSEIIIPNTVTNLGSSVFNGCTNLTSVTISKSVKSMGISTFSGCTSLTNIIIPNNVTDMGSYTFYNCVGLADVAFPTNITRWGFSVFVNCKALSNLTIPNGVTNIGPYAFSGCTGLTNITIPNGIANIGNNIFSGCAGLTNVTISYGVTNIGDSSFSDCSGLTSITIPRSVTSLGSKAFSGCTNLESVYFAGNAPSLASENAFENANQVTVYYRAKTTGWGSSYAGRPTMQWIIHYESQFAFQTNESTITITGYIGADGDVIIPNEINGLAVSNIGNQAFVGRTNLTSILIPTGITNLGAYAFQGCTALANVTIPESVTTIGQSAFGGCTGLKTILVNMGNANYSSLDGVLFNKDQTTLIQCPGGKTGSYTIPTNVISIEANAFSYCANLVNITIPKTVTGIGNSAFNSCTNLASVYFEGNAPTFAPDDLFSNASHVTIYYHPGMTGWLSTFAGRPAMQLIGPNDGDFPWQQIDTAIHIVGYNGSGGTVTIPNEINGLPVTSIEASAFEGNTKLMVVTIPNCVTNIGPRAFFGCSNLASVAIPRSAITIGYSQFVWCRGMTNIMVDLLNPAYSSIDGVLFNKNATTLIDVPEGKMGSYTIPDGVQILSDNAFLNCTGLTNITIPTSTTTFRYYAFYGCTGLTEITLPKSVISILSDAFTDCKHLTTIIVDNDNPAFSSLDGVLFNKNQTSVVQYPPGKIGSYIIPNGVTSLADSSFAFRYNLTSVIMPNSLTNIGWGAFQGCSSFTNITIPNSVTMIQHYAFQSCANLTDVLIPGSVKVIQSGAFSYCRTMTNISVDPLNKVYSSKDGVLLSKDQTILIEIPEGTTGSFTIPNGITFIAGSAFDRCIGITGVTIPDSVIEIGTSAFSYCTGLTNITIPKSVRFIGTYVFYCCSNLQSVFFEGVGPKPDPDNLFTAAPNVTVYYRPETTGWGTTYAGRPTALWIEQTPFQQWAQNVGLLDKFPDASAETDDADHDGMSNLAEMQAGTDPTMATSALKFERTPRLADLTDNDKTAVGSDRHALYFQSVPGKQYKVESATAFDDTWQAETNVTATTTQKRVLVSKPLDQRFYRVALVP